jgi:general secretion pathway protein F
VQTLGPLAWIILVVPGIALLMAARIFYRKQVLSSNLGRLSLSIAAWLMIVLGLLGTVIGALLWLSIPFLPLFFIALLMLVDRFRRSEHHALLNTLAFAAEKGIPLPETARAYAQENSGDTGVRAQYLAEQIEAGASLSAATRGCRLRLATPLRLAVNLSDVLTARGLALRSQLQWGSDTDASFRTIINRLLYLCAVFLLLLFVLTFTMIKIVPVYHRMYQEFGLILPEPTELLVSVSKWFVKIGWVYLAPLTIASAIALVLGALYYTGWYDFPVVVGTQASRRYAHVADVLRLMDLGLALRYLFWRYDASLVLRSLSLLLAQKIPLPQALVLLANVYPRGNVRRRLTLAAMDVERGGDWKQALQRQWLLGTAEAAVLNSAARAGNLPWALDEMGEGLMRRMTYRLMLLHQFLYPVLLLIFGGIVAFVSIALMIPLIGLIQGLA